MLKLEVLDGQMRVPCDWFVFFREEIHAPPIHQHYGSSWIMCCCYMARYSSWQPAFSFIGKIFFLTLLATLPATLVSFYRISPRWCHDEACHGSNILASTSNTGRVKAWKTLLDFKPNRGMLSSLSMQHVFWTYHHHHYHYQRLSSSKIISRAIEQILTRLAIKSLELAFFR